MRGGGEGGGGGMLILPSLVFSSGPFRCSGFIVGSGVQVPESIQLLGTRLGDIICKK